MLSDTAQVRPKAFSNIGIQDRNTMPGAENAMSVQAREGLCHETNGIQDKKLNNINLARSDYPEHLDRLYPSVHPHRSYRTLRDGSFGVRCPRHFVPGYDRAVPPGHLPVALIPPYAHSTAQSPIRPRPDRLRIDLEYAPSNRQSESSLSQFEIPQTQRISDNRHRTECHRGPG
jgi:hypothetical protein